MHQCFRTFFDIKPAIKNLNYLLEEKGHLVVSVHLFIHYMMNLMIFGDSLSMHLKNYFLISKSYHLKNWNSSISYIIFSYSKAVSINFGV